LSYMIRKHGQLYLTALLFLDALAVSLSWLFAYLIRFKLELIAPSGPIPSENMYLYAIGPVWMVFLFSGRVFGFAYQPSKQSRLRQALEAFKLSSVSVLMLMALTFFMRELTFSRIMVVYFWGIATIMLFLSHQLVGLLIKEMHSRGVNLKKVLVVGAEELGQKVVERLGKNPEIGFSVVGYLSDSPDNVGKTFKDHTVLGVYQEVVRVIRENEVDQLFIALPYKAHDRLEEILTSLGEETVDIKLVPDLLRYMDLHSGVEELDGIPLINLFESPLYGWNIVLKRVSDIALSGFALIVAFPFMVLIALALKLESRGPLIYRQERMGLDRNVFWMYKFRSMTTEAENQSGPVWAKENDDRRTRVGTILRETSLDELPQLFNVFKGQMSLVGPRPERPVFVEEFKKSIPFYMLRLKMKAGLTGWAQVNGWRGNTSLEKRIECDLYYIKNWSLLFDLKILVMTLWKGLINRHAY
jgi:Undecaprenyl-phosphate glucose phosphotransferase